MGSFIRRINSFDTALPVSRLQYNIRHNNITQFIKQSINITHTTPGFTISTIQSVTCTEKIIRYSSQYKNHYSYFTVNSENLFTARVNKQALLTGQDSTDEISPL